MKNISKTEQLLQSATKPSPRTKARFLSFLYALCLLTSCTFQPSYQAGDCVQSRSNDNSILRSYVKILSVKEKKYFLRSEFEYYYEACLISADGKPKYEQRTTVCWDNPNSRYVVSAKEFELGDSSYNSNSKTSKLDCKDAI